MNRGSGFTLIELLVTIAIAAILLALAVPSFRETTLNNQRATLTNELLADLNYARTQAVSLRAPVTVCRTVGPTAPLPTCATGTGWEEGWIVFVDSNNNGTLEAADATRDVNGDGITNASDAAPLRRQGAAQIFTIRGNGLPALGVVNRISFAPTGAANAGTLIACDSRDDFTKARAIVVSLGGRVQSFNTFTAAGSRDARLSATVTTCQR